MVFFPSLTLMYGSDLPPGSWGWRSIPCVENYVYIITVWFVLCVWWLCYAAQSLLYVINMWSIECMQRFDVGLVFPSPPPPPLLVGENHDSMVQNKDTLSRTTLAVLKKWPIFSSSLHIRAILCANTASVLFTYCSNCTYEDKSDTFNALLTYPDDVHPDNHFNGISWRYIGKDWFRLRWSIVG